MDAVLKKKLVMSLVFTMFVIVAIISQMGFIPWTHHSGVMHSLLQSIATIIALFCGAGALYRYYTVKIKSNMLLFIGVGFIGTTVIDAYHTIVTSIWFAQTFPEVPSTVARWSWLATRAFLSALLVLSLFGAVRGKDEKIVNEKIIYLAVAILTAVALTIFITVPIPFPIYPENFIPRPLELIPGILFLIALIGYLKKGKWKTNDFEYWIVLSLIAGTVCQFAYMDFSGQLYDVMFQMSHIVKIASYLMVYLGITA